MYTQKTGGNGLRMGHLVRLFHHTPAAFCCCGFAAVRPTGRKYQSITALLALSSSSATAQLSAANPV